MPKVYLIRHGKAEPRRVGLSDRNRQLLPKGKKQMRLAARFLMTMGVQPKEIFCSDLIRGRESANEFKNVFGLVGLENPAVKEVADLFAPNNNPMGLFDFLKETCNKNGLMNQIEITIIGHEPLLGAWMGIALQGLNAKPFPIKKGGIACLELEKFSAGNASLKFFMEPKEVQTCIPSKKRR